MIANFEVRKKRKSKRHFSPTHIWKDFGLIPILRGQEKWVTTLVT
jgi:hypothetical protein